MNITPSISNPLPLYAFTPKIGAAVNEATTNLGVPVEVAMTVALGAASLATQHLADVQRPEMKPSPISLNLGCITPTGAGKTPVSNQFLFPFEEFERSQNSKAESQRVQYETDLLIWEAKKRSIVKQISKLEFEMDSYDLPELHEPAKQLNQEQDELQAMHEQLKEKLFDHISKKPREPTKFRMIIKNATAPALTEVQSTNHSASIWSDDADIVLKSDMMNSLANFNDIWSGTTQYIDRRTTGSHVVRNARLSWMLMPQEEPWNNFIATKGRGAMNNGFLPRMLLTSVPADNIRPHYLGPHELSWDHLPKFNERCRELLKQNSVANGAEYTDRKVLKFTTEGARFFRQVFNEIKFESQPNGCLSGAREFSAKMPEHIARLAAVMHCFEGYEGDISAETLNNAVQIIKWYAFEHIRLFPVKQDVLPEEEDAKLLDEWLTKRAKKGMTVLTKSYLETYGPYRLRKADRLDEALQILILNGRVSVKTMGKSVNIYIGNCLLPPRATYPFAQPQLLSSASSRIFYS